MLAAATSCTNVFSLRPERIKFGDRTGAGSFSAAPIDAEVCVSQQSTALRVFSLTMVLLLGDLRSPALAQQFNGTLRGTVQDSTGAVLPGAAVSVIEIGTNDTRRLTTDEIGRAHV